MFVRPSTKLVKVNYALAILLGGAAYWLAQRYGAKIPPAATYVAYAIAVMWFIMALFRHLKLMFTTLSADGDRLMMETGFLGKSTRALNLAKVQDVRADQTFIGRIIGVGTLTLETASESGRLTIENIDQPRRVADEILSLARRAAR